MPKFHSLAWSLPSCFFPGFSFTSHIKRYWGAQMCLCSMGVKHLNSVESLSLDFSVPPFSTCEMFCSLGDS